MVRCVRAPPSVRPCRRRGEGTVPQPLGLLLQHLELELREAIEFDSSLPLVVLFPLSTWPQMTMQAERGCERAAGASVCAGTTTLEEEEAHEEGG